MSRKYILITVDDYYIKLIKRNKNNFIFNFTISNRQFKVVVSKYKCVLNITNTPIQSRNYLVFSYIDCYSYFGGNILYI